MIWNGFSNRCCDFETLDELYKSVTWVERSCVVRGHDGIVHFEMHAVEVPESWSQNATDVLASKYFYKRDGFQEKSLKQVISRMTTFWAHRAIMFGHISPEQAMAFKVDLAWCMIYQLAAPNSPQWFNAGIDQYRDGNPHDSHYHEHPDKPGEVIASENAYTYPQLHACFINSVGDSLVGPGSITDLVAREASIFKYGSGAGSNFSAIRSKNEPLLNGGVSSGLMPYLQTLDRSAGSIKSGGTTRKAAKMVILDSDHPEIFEFIRWKSREELKVKAMVEGYELFKATTGAEEYERLGLVLDYDFNGEAYGTVSGQNANNSVRLLPDFMEALEMDNDYILCGRVADWVDVKIDPGVLLDEIAASAWSSGDPGVQFQDNIDEWHTCPKAGKINASNPCSEYLFLDDTACNLASLNVAKFIVKRGVDFALLSIVASLWTLVLDLSVSAAQYPGRKMAENSLRFRTLGLGFMNMGAALVKQGLAYDSDSGRQFAAFFQATLWGVAAETSTHLAERFGPFPGFERERYGEILIRRTSLLHGQVGRNPGLDKAFSSDWHDRICELYARVVRRFRDYGFRNAQFTNIAPTGTIGLVTDCETSGIEPFFSTLTMKKLSGGGTMMLTAPSIEEYLERVGLDPAKVQGLLDSGRIDEIDPEVRAVISTAVGQLSLSPEAHMLMMAAVQSFVCGAISKTVNVPNSYTKQDIRDLILRSHRHGIKALAVYRDGCKFSQPMNAVKSQKPAEPPREIIQAPADIPTRDIRYKIPDTRDAVTHKFRISGCTGFVTLGIDGGRIVEIFIRMARAGSTLHGLMECLGKSLSLMLQSGVSVENVFGPHVGVRFAPGGITSNKEIPFCSSVIDYIARWTMAYEKGLRGQEAGLPAVETHVDPSRPPVRAERLGDPSEGTGDRYDNLCEVCGHFMVRTGTCFKCPNCGAGGGCE